MPELPGVGGRAPDGPRLTIGQRCASWRDTEIEPVDPAQHSAALDGLLANAALDKTPIVVAADADLEWRRVAQMLDVLQAWGGNELEVVGAGGTSLSVTQLGARRLDEGPAGDEACVKVSVELALDGVVVSTKAGQRTPCPTVARNDPGLDWDLVAETVSGRMSPAAPGCNFVVVGAESDRPWSEVALALTKFDNQRVFVTTSAPSLSCYAPLAL